MTRVYLYLGWNSLFRRACIVRTVSLLRTQQEIVPATSRSSFGSYDVFVRVPILAIKHHDYSNLGGKGLFWLTYAG